MGREESATTGGDRSRFNALELYVVCTTKLLSPCTEEGVEVMQRLSPQVTVLYGNDPRLMHVVVSCRMSSFLLFLYVVPVYPTLQPVEHSRPGQYSIRRNEAYTEAPGAHAGTW